MNIIFSKKQTLLDFMLFMTKKGKTFSPTSAHPHDDGYEVTFLVTKDYKLEFETLVSEFYNKTKTAKK